MSESAVSNAAELEYNGSSHKLTGDLSVDDTSSPLGLSQDSTTSEESSKQTTRVSINVSDATCFEGIESTLDVMMPDRFVNLKSHVV